MFSLNKVIDFFSTNRRLIIIIYILFALIAGTQSYLQKNKRFQEGGREYTHYNNYKIFKQSYFHLIEGKDLYKEYPEEQWDLFKYSPSFPVFFGLFSHFPDILGINLWNLLNALILLFSIISLPSLDIKKKHFILYFILIEMMTSLQNQQSNTLIAGLLIFAFGFLEKDKYMLSSLFIVLSIFIKLFGIVFILLYFLYPKRWKLFLFSGFWFIIIFFLPLIHINFTQLKDEYIYWYHCVQNDQSISYGMSVYGWLKTWFDLNIPKVNTLFAGMILLLIPFLKVKNIKDVNFRLMLLSSLLIWIVIFNHKAESPTFIIAMSGIAIWYSDQKNSLINLILIIACFILTSLSPTDIFPRNVRESYISPYVLKAVPCIFIWFKLTYDMLMYKGIIANSGKLNVLAE